MLIRRKITPPPPHSWVKERAWNHKKHGPKAARARGAKEASSHESQMAKRASQKRPRFQNDEVPWFTPWSFASNETLQSVDLTYVYAFWACLVPPFRPQKYPKKLPQANPRTPLFGGSKIAETVIYTVFEDKTKKCENNKKTIKMKTQKSPRRFIYKHFGDFSCPPKTT